MRVYWPSLSSPSRLKKGLRVSLNSIGLLWYFLYTYSTGGPITTTTTWPLAPTRRSMTQRLVFVDLFTGSSRVNGWFVKGRGSFSNRVRRPQLMQRYTTKDMPVSRSTSWSRTSVPSHLPQFGFWVIFTMFIHPTIYEITKGPWRMVTHWVPPLFNMPSLNPQGHGHNSQYVRLGNVV